MLPPFHQYSPHRDGLFSEFEDELQKVTSKFYRLVWLTGGMAGARSLTLGEFAKNQRYPCINVGAKLSEALVDIPARQRAAFALDGFSDLLPSADCVVLDRLEILFEPGLQVNPLDLVKKASRHRLILAAWPGEIDDMSFIFGQPDHPAHQDYPLNRVEDHFITL